jgi:hypothetical protein
MDANAPQIGAERRLELAARFRRQRLDGTFR